MGNSRVFIYQTNKVKTKQTYYTFYHLKRRNMNYLKDIGTNVL